jgi:ABC-type lipoprotein export system ATPase subunit
MNYLEEIKKKYDIKDYVEAPIKIPNLPTDGIVLIVGTSGSGKSTILRSLRHNQTMTLSPCSTVIENFSTAERGEELLLAVGLRSIPAWFRLPATLSNGESHRFEMALAIDQGIQCIDEFTSVVDRDTARALAYSVRQYYDRNPGVLYIASCHRDITSMTQTCRNYLLGGPFIFDWGDQPLHSISEAQLRTLGDASAVITI